MTEGLENTRSENNQVPPPPPPLPCSVALRGISVFIREYRENARGARGLTLTAKNLMKSFQPFSLETIVSSVSLLYIASQRLVRLRYTAEEKSRCNPLSFANIQGYPHEFSTEPLYS